MTLPAIAAYLVLTAAWVYGVADTDAFHDWWWMPLLAGLQLGVGYVIGRWWAVALAATVPLLAIPAGAPEDGDSPLAAGVFFYMPLLAALLALGVGVRKLRDRART